MGERYVKLLKINSIEYVLVYCMKSMYIYKREGFIWGKKYEKLFK